MASKVPGTVASNPVDVLLVASTGFCAGYFFFVYRTDLQTDDAVAHQVIKVASDGAVALLSYSPGTLTQDFNKAKSLVTEDYLAYYQQFAEKIVGPAAMRGQVTTTATVIRAAVSELHPNSAVVLVFLKTEDREQGKATTSGDIEQNRGVADEGQWQVAYREIQYPNMSTARTPQWPFLLNRTVLAKTVLVFEIELKIAVFSASRST